jgi:tRNA A-37 threonylcarbamoyl transferase component Bud32
MNTISTIGDYTGMVADHYRSDDLVAALSGIARMMQGKEVDPGGRNMHARIKLPSARGEIEVAVKSFSRQLVVKDWLDSKCGSRARRSWKAAHELSRCAVGTPEPVAFLENWDGRTLVESYYITVFQENVVSFKDELIRLFKEDSECSSFMSLLEYVSGEIRCMHAAGFLHNDLGNQNILLRRDDLSGWKDAQFIDLNRGSVKPSLSFRERARDISRIYLPSDLLRVFKEMYFDDVPSPSFQKWEGFFRRLYALHSATRALRHPFRELKKRASGDQHDYPSEDDMWIWDEKSAQSISTLLSKDKRRYRSKLDTIRIAGTVLSGGVSVKRLYGELLDECWKEPVNLDGCFGVAIEPTESSRDQELSVLAGLGKVPTIVRAYYHKGEKQWDFACELIRDLDKAGHKVSLALVQDRAAVKNPEGWSSFVSHVLGKVSDCVDWVELGHAANRVKWGVWRLREYERFMKETWKAVSEYPEIKVMGPAAIDFEYPFVMSALSNVPAGCRYNALSHLLYVDRRGAPENMQGSFSALEKFALARSMARWSNACEDKLIVSEVNWPLLETGVYSPVGCPYESPGIRHGDPSVGEDDYADYMLRYMLIAVCSGMVERVYWWRMTAHGYGLVDDKDVSGWRKRPAYHMFKHLVDVLEGGRYLERVAGLSKGLCALVFETRAKDRVCIVYSSCGEMQVELPFEVKRATDALGNVIEATGQKMTVAGRPLYLDIE